jgi:predicted DsbA family dithiol-disulfide isomerase
MMADYNIAVLGRAFLLRPDTPKEGLERRGRPGETETELSEPLRSYAQESSLVMRPPKVTPNTMYALEATEYAQQHGKFMEFHKAAYRAYWEDGKDLGDLAVLGEIARKVSLDSLELLEHLKSGHYTSTILAQHQEAVQHGIQGIPTFLVGNLLFTGAQPYQVFQMVMSRVLSK